MRDPLSPDQPKNAEIAAQSTASTETATAGTGIAAVSLPDRRRIDSDVRAFLREPSTPWIVFDREGRPPSQLAVGEVLTVPRKTLLSDYNFFPATAAVDSASHSSSHVKLEPSSLAVASDLEGDDASEDAPVALPMTARLSRRVLGASAAALAIVSLLGVGIYAMRSASQDGIAARTSLSAQSSQRTFGAAVPAEIPPPDLAVAAPVKAAAPVAVATPVAAPASAPAVFTVRDDARAGASASSKKYARLSVAGDARGKDVFLDGKRMLGRGARSFTVMCGPHTIAVSNRADAHDVDVPCGAELVVGK